MEFEEYLRIERSIPGLDDFSVQGVPVWRLARLHFRWMVMNDRPFTVKPKIQLKDQLLNNHKSFCSLMRLRFSGKKIGNVFFPHPRLYLVDGIYMDRLSDPLIDYSGYGDDYIVFERHQNGIHRTPRLHGEKVVYQDFIDNATRLLSIPAKPFVGLFHRKGISALAGRLAQGFGVSERTTRGLIAKALTEFLLRKWLISPVLRRISPKRVFLAPRATYQHVIAFCKKYGISSVELQHGVTVGETELYSGQYEPRIDPDYFFVFGSSNIGPQFGIPEDRIRNIGFPYKKYITSLGLEKFGPNVTLVISEPQISGILLDVILGLSEAAPDHIFHIRCHPQEKLGPDLMKKIDGKRIVVVDNKIESFCALSQYDQVIGENSSVMYEAMSLKKKIGRLNYGGLHVIETALIHGGTIINSPEDFVSFVTNPYSGERDAKEIYSDFNISALQSI